MDTNNFLHTNFKIAKEGETIYLYSPDQVLLSELSVDCNDLDNGKGSFPDGGNAIYYFQSATPSATNNSSAIYTGYLTTPVIDIPSGFYNTPLTVTLINPNPSSAIRYTLDGNDPTPNSPVYQGTAIPIGSSKVLKARAFAPGILPSPVTASSYFFGVEHTTPVLSVITNYNNLYGPSGIFDNWWYDWERNAYR